MTDLMERTPVQDVVLDEPTVVPEAPKVEPPVKPSRKERGVDVPTTQRPVRWFHWMIAVLVLLVGATALVYTLQDDGTTAVLDTDGSFQAVEAQRLQRLAPATVDLTDGSFQAAETQRLQRLAPSDVEARVLDTDGSFQYVETQRMLRLAPGS